MLTERLQSNALGEYDAVPEIAEWLERWQNDIPKDASKELSKAIKKRNRTPMTQTQVNSAIALINRTLPVLQATTLTTYEGDKQSIEQYTDEELAEIIANNGKVASLKPDKG